MLAKSYTTDGKVAHFSKEKDVNEVLGQIIGPRFVEYRERWDAVNRFELISEFPLFLQLDMNQECNLKCKHCIVAYPKEKRTYYSGGRLTWDWYVRIVLEGEEHACPSIAPQGNNEPLLLGDLERYIEYAQKHGFIDIMINTNATILSEERSRRLLDSGLTRIRFSLDAATPETYKRIREGDYNEVRRNIERFLELKESGGYRLPVTGVSFCRMSQNEEELAKFVEIWKDKVDMVSVQMFVPPTLEGNFAAYYPARKAERNGVARFRCPQPFQRVTVRNYDITPCCAMYGVKLKIGNIKTTSIRDAWKSPEMHALREIHRDGRYWENAICRKCVELVEGGRM